MIKAGSQVKLHYTLTVDDQVIDSSRGAEPLSYVHGQGEIVPGLEEQLEGLTAGDTKTTTVAPEKGYGDRRQDALHKVPRTAFENAPDLKKGDVVSGEAQGKPFEATVAEVEAEHVTLDLNHRLAGKSLRFEVEIIEVG